MKNILAYTLLTGITLLIGSLFYFQEIKYWIPTELPNDYVDVPLGSRIDLNEFSSELKRKKFIHFFNPNCPCSKFNFKSYKALLKNYVSEFDCYVVVQNSLKDISGSDLDYLNKLGVKLLTDDQSIARSLGVYATPQIALLDSDNKLYYRGNYNQARYCTNKTTSYAQIAIDSMLIKSQYNFPANAFTAYGCSLEKHTH